MCVLYFQFTFNEAANSGWLKTCCDVLSLRLRGFSCFCFLVAGPFTTLPSPEGQKKQGHEEHFCKHEMTKKSYILKDFSFTTAVEGLQRTGKHTAAYILL